MVGFFWKAKIAGVPAGIPQTHNQQSAKVPYTPFTLVTREITRVIHRVISRVTPGWHSFHTGERDREGSRVNFSRRLLCSGSTYVCIYGTCIQSPRAPELRWKKRKHSIGIWRMHIHFERFVLWRDNDRPDFTREFNRDAFHTATSPGSLPGTIRG